MFVVLTAVIDCSIDKYLPDPSFKRIYFVRIGRRIAMDFFKNFQQGVIKNFYRVFFSFCISVADSHAVAVERVVDFFLTLSPVQSAASDVFI